MNIDAAIKGYREDFEDFAKKVIKIRDHNTSKILPLIFNNGQRILHVVAEKQKKEKGSIRILLLKSRRFGGSTYIEGRFYWRSALNSNRSTFIIGHETDSTATLYGMAKLMQERNPIAPATRKSNAQELIFDNAKGTGLKSQYRLATAANLHAGKSQGITYLHDSEEAMWANAEELLSGLLQCVPDPPAEAEVFRESTANGCGDRFHKDVMDTYREGLYPYHVQDGITYAWYNPESDWILVFIPWFVHERYTREFENEERKKAFIEKLNAEVFDKTELKWVKNEGKKLQEQFNLSLEQLYWRDWAITNKCGGNIEKFHENYPSNVEEAFLSSGTNVFSKTLCDEMEAACKEPILVGDVIERMGKPKVKPNTHGHFRIWGNPGANERYFMTIDSAGGKKESQKQAGTEPDPSCIDVWHHRSGTQVAQWHGHIDYDLIADIVEIIGNMFNRAVACVELNNHGYTVVADLNRKHYPMYCAKSDEPGWVTSRRTKPQMVDGLYEMARDGGLKIMSKETVSEMRTFIEENGKYEAAPGCHDERVDTGGMAAQMMKLLPVGASRLNVGAQNKIINWDRHIRSREKRDYGEYKEVVVNR